MCCDSNPLKNVGLHGHQSSICAQNSEQLHLQCFHTHTHAHALTVNLTFHEDMYTWLLLCGMIQRLSEFPAHCCCILFHTDSPNSSSLPSYCYCYYYYYYYCCSTLRRDTTPSTLWAIRINQNRHNKAAAYLCWAVCKYLQHPRHIVMLWTHQR